MTQGFDEFKKYHNANYHDGDPHFDERTYKKSNGDDFDCSFVQDCYDHFEAGAASRQAEIDELQKRLAMYEREGYKLVPVEPNEKQWGGLSRHLGRYMQMNDRYCPKTLKKYFDRFIGEPPEWLTKEVGNWDSEHAFATADLPVFIYKAMIGACDD